MGKRTGKRNNNYQKGSKKVKVQQQWKEGSGNIPKQNKIFKQYYKLQLQMPQQQFEIFWQHMKIKLPVVFRVNHNCANYSNFCKKLESQNFLKSIVDFNQISEQQKNQNKDQPTQMPKLTKIEWYPNQTVYQLNATKQMFKKSKILNKLHQYLQKCFDSGLISRQQLVSMLPPLYLNLQEGDIVLDMCAAPGSKTSQMAEIMSGEYRKLMKGCIVANDADYSRAQMLIHQIQRCGTAGIAAVNHPGQFFPELFTYKTANMKQKFQFNKILCDVPCSGDGATRKIPIKWSVWHTSDGQALHPLQLAILMKAINLLKKDGLLVYSTCSLNPIENQAVVTALMNKVHQGLEIIDIHKLYNVKGRRGMLSWKVCTVQKQQKIIQEKDQENKNTPKHERYIKIHNSYEQIKYNMKIRETMFPLDQQYMKKIGIDGTMRILPHDQNSGGFYVALFKKSDNFQWKYNVGNNKKQQKVESEELKEQMQQKVFDQNLPVLEQMLANQQNQEAIEQQQEQIMEKFKDQQINQKQSNENEQQEQNQNKEKKIKEKKGGSKYQAFTNISEEQFQLISSFYGLKPEIKDLLYVRENGGSQQKVMLITQGLSKYLKADIQNKIKLVNMGCKAFQKGKQSFAGHQCLYRLSQQGIHFLLDYLDKRKVKVSLQFFRSIIAQTTIVHEEIKQQNIVQELKKLTQGSFCIYIDEIVDGKRIIDAMVGQNFKNSFHLMVSKEQIQSLKIRYL